MAKRIEIDGKFYRRRRGKLVQIPDEWVGRDTHQQTIRKRLSKEVRKLSYLRNSWTRSSNGESKHPNHHPPRLARNRPQPRDEERELE